MPLNTSIRWAMSIVFALTWVQLVNAQGSHRVLAPPKNAPSSLDPHEDLIREVERFVKNSDSSLDIDPEEIDPELLKMAQRWAQQFQKPEDLPDSFRELIESLGPKLQSSESGARSQQPLPDDPNAPQPEEGPLKRPQLNNPNGNPQPGKTEPENDDNSLKDPNGNVLDPDLFQPPNFNEPNNTPRPSQRPGSSDIEQSNDANSPTIQVPNGERKGERPGNLDPAGSPNVRQPDGQQPIGRNPGVTDKLAPVPGKPVPGKPVPGKPVPSEPVPSEPVPSEPVPSEPTPSDLSPGDIVPEVQQSTDSHRSEILDGLRDSDLTIKQQWNRILEQARRDAILDDNPAQEGNGGSALSNFLEETFGETIADAVDKTHQPRNPHQHNRTIRGRGPISNSNQNSNASQNSNSSQNRRGPNRGSSTNQRPRTGDDPFRNRDNPFLPNGDNANRNPSHIDSGNSNARTPQGNPQTSNQNNRAGSNSNGNEPNGNSPNRNHPNGNSPNTNSPNANSPDARRPRANNSRRPEPPKGNSKGGFTGGIKDLANFGEDLFMKVANAEQSNSRDPKPDPDTQENQDSGESSAFSIQTPFMLLMVMLVLIGCAIWLAKVRQQKIAVAAQIAAAAVKMPSDLATKTDVLDAFHAMSAKTAAAESPWWTHRRAATELFESAPHGRHALEALTTVYEQARYLPGDEPLDDNELSTARQALTLYDQQ